MRYTTMEELGINISDLRFQPMPDASEVLPPHQESRRAEEQRRDSGLTIAEAKKGLSLKFGVPIDAIEIIIKG